MSTFLSKCVSSLPVTFVIYKLIYIFRIKKTKPETNFVFIIERITPDIICILFLNNGVIVSPIIPLHFGNVIYTSPYYIFPDDTLPITKYNITDLVSIFLFGHFFYLMIFDDLGLLPSLSLPLLITLFICYFSVLSFESNHPTFYHLCETFCQTDKKFTNSVVILYPFINSISRLPYGKSVFFLDWRLCVSLYPLRVSVQLTFSVCVLVYDILQTYFKILYVLISHHSPSFNS